MNVYLEYLGGGTHGPLLKVFIRSIVYILQVKGHRVPPAKPSGYTSSASNFSVNIFTFFIH